MITTRQSEERGSANLGWLKSKHTFSFADYYDHKYSGYGSLRVINEDHLAPGKGFPEHPHRDYEIFTYVIRGAIEHEDSMGNVEICKPGDIQFTSAGSGISHSEFSVREYGPLHFLQIWVKPNKSGLKPHYTTGTFPDEIKRNKLCLCVSGDGENGSIAINQDIKVYASLLEDNQNLTFVVKPGRKVYIHVVENSGSLVLDNGNHLKTLAPGDGAFIENPQQLQLAASSPLSHFLLFDVAA